MWYSERILKTQRDKQSFKIMKPLPPDAILRTNVSVILLACSGYGDRLHDSTYSIGLELIIINFDNN